MALLLLRTGYFFHMSRSDVKDIVANVDFNRIILSSSMFTRTLVSFLCQSGQ